MMCLSVEQLGRSDNERVRESGETVSSEVDHRTLNNNKVSGLHSTEIGIS